MTELTTESKYSLRAWITSIVVILAVLLMLGYITNDQFAALVDRLIPIGAMAT